MTERNHSRHSIVNENCANISVFINHFEIVFTLLLMFNKRRKFCISMTSNMLSRVRLWLRQKNITCFNVCLNQSQKHVEMTMMSNRRWNKYFVNSIRILCICVIKLFLTLNKLSWSFRRFLNIWDDNATQFLRLFVVWYSFQNHFHLLCNVFLRFLFVIELSICVVFSFSAQNFVNQTRLRFFDVVSTWRRLLSRVWMSCAWFCRSAWWSKRCASLRVISFWFLSANMLNAAR
jgi:hypothetical protein